jgi:hypothetical protein
VNPFAESNCLIRSERVSLELGKIVLNSGNRVRRHQCRVSFRAPGQGAGGWYNGRGG